MPATSGSQCWIETRACNKLAHPGNIVKSTTQRRTSAEVQQERDTQTKAKATHEKAKQQSIICTAEFEHADIANEEMGDATPCPPFTPKPWPPPRNHKKGNAVPATESSDVDMANDSDQVLFVPASDSTAENDSASESDVQDPPPKKEKGKAAKGKGKVKPITVKAIKNKKRADRDDEDVESLNDEETPKAKKVKVKMRDEISAVTKTLMESKKPYDDILKLTSDRQVGERPAPKVTLQPVGGRKLKREGAIKNIMSYSDEVTPANINDDIDNGNSYRMQHISAINEWASAIAVHGSQVSKSATSSCHKSNIPLLTNDNGSRSSAPSVLSNTVKIISHPPDLTKVKAEPTPHDGGLSDSDEIRGEEREVVMKSPPKGKKHVTSEQLIAQKPSKTNEAAARKTRNEELPDWVEVQWFCHTFITTYMVFVGQTVNPWDVSTKQAVKVMQKIWDATSNYKYEITTSTWVYQKTVQCLADSWHNVIGSNSIMVLMAFFDSQPDLQDSDSNRVRFAEYFLKDLQFLYKDTQDKDKKVVIRKHDPLNNIMKPFQSWKGLFHSPFILQTFASHLATIEGSVNIPGLHNDKPNTTMVGGLGLAAASVERALTLIATGTLTILLTHATKGKTIPLPRTINLSSSKESMRQTGFSDVAWGQVTHSYTKSASSLTNTKFDSIVQEA